MIVRDAGDAWQVVLQTDHADLSGAFARAWREQGPHHDALVIAAERHDDGWAVWERAPMIDPDTHRPLNFLDVQVPAHLAFYRACIAAVTDDDPYAGLLVSMHGAGIYRQRYGRDPALGLTRAPEVADQVEAFVEEQEARYPERIDALGVAEDERWANYELLQLFDRLSLYFCMRDVESGEAADVQGYQLEPIEPWRVRMQPFPFRNGEARFTLLRRVLPAREWTQEEFREQFFALEPERTEITIDA
jgi:Protein of unknown function (DUF3891)